MSARLLHIIPQMTSLDRLELLSIRVVPVRLSSERLGISTSPDERVGYVSITGEDSLTIIPPPAPSIDSFSTEEPGTFSASISIGRPVGVVEGDMLMCVIAGRQGSAGMSTVTLPAGWTLLFTTHSGNGPGHITKVVSYRIATAGEPETYSSWEFDKSLRAVGGILRISGHSTDPPAYYNFVSGTSGDIIVPGLTVPEYTLVIFMGDSTDATSPNVSVPAGMTSLWGLSNFATTTTNMFQRGASQIMSGDTGAITASHAGGIWSGALLTIRRYGT